MNWTSLNNVFSSNESAKQFIINSNLIPHRMDCEYCEKKMIPRKNKNSSFNVLWYCPQCQTTLPLFYNSFFQTCRSNYHLYLKIIYCFSQDYDLKQTYQETKMNNDSICDLFFSLRLKCFSFYKKNQKKIGGLGLEVQVDETFLSKRKNNKGRYTSKYWVVGGICQATNEIFLVPTLERNEETLKEIIFENVEFGSFIITDCWKGYNFFDKNNPNPYTHDSVNHKENFINPITGSHTQSIERLWLEFKMMKKKRRGLKIDNLDFYIGEFIFRKNILNKSSDKFLEILKIIK